MEQDRPKNTSVTVMLATLSLLLTLALTVTACALVVLSTQLIVPSPHKLEVSYKANESTREISKEDTNSNTLTVDLGLTQGTAAKSCQEIAESRPDYPSGYYWVTGPAGPLGVYCEMAPQFEQDGGWMKVAGVDMRDTHSQCPNGLRLNVTSNKTTCSRPFITPGCSSTTFTVHSVHYNKVCGKVIGYQVKYTNGFGPSKKSPGIDQIYVDGVSITHGMPRQHIWTLASASGRPGSQQLLKYQYTACPCRVPSNKSFKGVLPSFVGSDYYCETGNKGNHSQATRTFTEDPLWDGKGCEGNDSCCDRGGPWFCKELESTTSDDIELRVCRNGKSTKEDVLLEQIELYVQ